MLRLRIQHLEHLFENTRVLACSYQNTSLALEPETVRTLELLGHALTKCSVDLQELKEKLQKPVAQAQWGVIRVTRRVNHVMDDKTLRRLSSKLQDDLVSLHCLLFGVSMYTFSHQLVEQC